MLANEPGDELPMSLGVLGALGLVCFCVCCGDGSYLQEGRLDIAGFVRALWQPVVAGFLVGASAGLIWKNPYLAVTGLVVGAFWLRALFVPVIH